MNIYRFYKTAWCYRYYIFGEMFFIASQSISLKIIMKVVIMIYFWPNSSPQSALSVFPSRRTEIGSLLHTFPDHVTRRNIMSSKTVKIIPSYTYVLIFEIENGQKLNQNTCNIKRSQ